MTGWPTEWDGLIRCEDHPAGTHGTEELAELCINADRPVQQLRIFDADCICEPLQHLPDPECEFPHVPYFMKASSRVWS